MLWGRSKKEKHNEQRKNTMSHFLWRVIIGVVCFLFAMALLPPLLGLLGIDVGGNLLQVLRLCIGGIVVIYIFFGPTVPWGPVS